MFAIPLFSALSLGLCVAGYPARSSQAAPLPDGPFPLGTKIVDIHLSGDACPTIGPNGGVQVGPDALVFDNFRLVSTDPRRACSVLVKLADMPPGYQMRLKSVTISGAMHLDLDTSAMFQVNYYPGLNGEAASALTWFTGDNEGSTEVHFSRNLRFNPDDLWTPCFGEGDDGQFNLQWQFRWDPAIVSETSWIGKNDGSDPLLQIFDVEWQECGNAT